MKGMELARGYYETYGRPMIHEKFRDYEGRIAAGLVGEGSECFGFDDEYSRDHDFGPAFCLWLQTDDFEAIGASLQAEYDKLPDWYGGMRVRRDHRLSGHRTGVWEVGEFYRHFLSVPGVPDNRMLWLRLPESYLAVAVNGEVFEDGLRAEEGSFSRIREKLQEGYPEDVRIKKMVARAAVMSQAGQYNYPRCQKRGETAAALLALAEFIRNGISMVYLLNRKYTPFYKWMRRGMERLELLQETAALFDRLAMETGEWRQKQEAIEEICRLTAQELKRQGLIDGSDPFLQNHLDDMMSKIEDGKIRQMHWLEG